MNSAARIEAFLEMMSAERGAAENTLSSYRRDLEDASQEIDGGLAGAGASEIRSYLDDIAERGFAPTSQARKLSAIRQFFKFLYAEGLRGDDPTGTLDSPKKGRPLPKTMSEAETGRLIDRAALEAGDTSQNDGDSLAALRLHALVEVLYATGLRVSELVGLPVTVALRDDRFFMVRGKGDKERMVPLSAKARTAMRAWLTVRATVPAFADSMFLFPAAVRHRLSLAAGVCPRPEGARRQGRHHRGEDLAACASPCFRQPSLAERRRPPGGAAAARPCRHLDHADLHPCAGGAAGAAGQRSSSACRLGLISLCEGDVPPPGASVFEGFASHCLPNCSVRSRMYNYLDFEKPVQDLEGKILELKKLAENGEAVDVGDEISRLEKRSRDALRDVYKALTPWQKVQVARHPDRPHCVDYIKGLFSDFTPLAGDRNFGEDQAIIGGFARFRGEPVAVHRPGEGLGHGKPAQAQFRLGAARRLPQGGAADGACRPLQDPAV